MGLGICELAPVLQGDDGIFGTLLDRVAGPAHVVNVWDAPLVHSARVIIEQINRTPEEAAALAEDFLGVIRDDPGACEAADWIFAAASVHALRRSPASDRFDMLTRTGIEAARPADAVILSVNAEPAVRLRHRRILEPCRVQTRRRSPPRSGSSSASTRLPRRSRLWGGVTADCSSEP